LFFLWTSDKLVSFNLLQSFRLLPTQILCRLWDGDEVSISCRVFGYFLPAFKSSPGCVSVVSISCRVFGYFLRRRGFRIRPGTVRFNLLQSFRLLPTYLTFLNGITFSAFQSLAEFSVTSYTAQQHLMEIKSWVSISCRVFGYFLLPGRNSFQNSLSGFQSLAEFSVTSYSSLPVLNNHSI